MGTEQMAIKLEGISKTMRKKQLLQPLHYQLSKGKILALCGGNGAGKSTLIRLLTGLHKPTTGQVTINGMNYSNKRMQVIEKIGYMPDNSHFQPSMTANEIISFYAQLKRIPKQQYLAALDAVGLLDRRYEKVGNFSKGMNQRLLLAQALLSKPPILILDEPTNGLDPYWIQQFCELMLQAKQNGQTIVFSTHDLHVAEKIADEVLFLQQGSLIHEGPISQYRQKGLYETFQDFY